MIINRTCDLIKTRFPKEFDRLPEILFSLVREGGTGYHLFEYCAQKICILKGDEK